MNSNPSKYLNFRNPSPYCDFTGTVGVEKREDCASGCYFTKSGLALKENKGCLTCTSNYMTTW